MKRFLTILIAATLFAATAQAGPAPSKKDRPTYPHKGMIERVMVCFELAGQTTVPGTYVGTAMVCYFTYSTNKRGNRK